jgi:hypothetical protein
MRIAALYPRAESGQKGDGEESQSPSNSAVER